MVISADVRGTVKLVIGRRAEKECVYYNTLIRAGIYCEKTRSCHIRERVYRAGAVSPLSSPPPVTGQTGSAVK